MTYTAAHACEAHLQVREQNERLWREALSRSIGPSSEEAARIIPMMEEAIRSASRQLRAAQEVSVDRLPQIRAFSGPFSRFQPTDSHERYWLSGERPRLTAGALDISCYFTEAGYRTLMRVTDRGALPYAFVRRDETSEIVYHPDGGDIKVQSVDLIVTWADDVTGTPVEQWREAPAQERIECGETGGMSNRSALLM